MNFPLQQTDHRHSSYERPNQQWECGWAGEGAGCGAGPDARGRCQVHRQSVCEPRKEGDRWMCSRRSVDGGPCERGPGPGGACGRPAGTHPPCGPRRRLRARRGRWVWAVSALSLGLLAMGLTSPWSLDVFSPGELSRAHASIDASAAGLDGGSRGQNCVACHTRAAGVDHALGALLAGGSREMMADSRQCATCHFDLEGPGGPHALAVHSQAFEAVAAATRRAEARAEARESADHLEHAGLELTLAAWAGSPMVNTTDPLACAVCHTEHRGLDHDLSFMSDTSCQICHTDRFAGFGRDTRAKGERTSDGLTGWGHPAFAETGVPGLQYNHLSHQRREGQGYACASCHEVEPGRVGRVVGLKAFEQSCLACHADDLKKLAEPLAVVRLPAMETDAAWYCAAGDDGGP